MRGAEITLEASSQPGSLKICSLHSLWSMSAAWGLWAWDLEGNWKAVGSRGCCGNRLQKALAIVEDPQESGQPFIPED